MKLRPFFWGGRGDRFKRAYLIKRNSVPTVGLGKSEKCICKTFLKINIRSLIAQKGANKADFSQIQRPSLGPSPLPAPSQKQKHVTSGSTCLTPPAVRKAASPQGPPSATSSSEGLQRRSTHSHKAHSATGLNTRKWEVMYFY